MEMSHNTALSRAWTLALVLATTVAALALWMLDPIPAQSLRLAQFDQFQRWHPRPDSPPQVWVVDIDEASLKALGQWPWPRTRLADLVERLHEAGAAAIALDVLLAEPDRTSPRAVAALWDKPELQALLQGLPDHDTVLARTLGNKSVVLGSSLSNDEAAAPAQALLAPYRIVRSGTGDPAHWLHGFDGAIWPLPQLAAGASGVGAMNFTADSDGVLRRVPLYLRMGEHIIPTLSAEALRVAQGARNHVLRVGEAGMQDARIGAVTVPTNAQAEVWLYFSQQAPTNIVPAAQVLNGQLPFGLLNGKIALVGSSAAGLMDLRTNPMGKQMPGVLAHALALEQMLSNRHILRPAWALAAEALALLIGALTVGMVALRAPVRWSVLLAAGTLATLLGGTWLAFAHYHLLLDAANPALAVLLVFGLASSLHHRASERQQRWVREAFSRYVSPNRVAHLIAHPEQLKLGGRRQVCSFVFTDLAGFTRMVEGCDPAQLVKQINGYLDEMLEIVFKHEGTLDRFMGDALVVMFSAPVEQSDHCQRALDCALEMHAFASDYARRLQSQGVAWGHTRIGVHSGEVIVGNFGGSALFDYRALGDPINTASRLESVNKHLGTWVCVSKATLEGCAAVAVRPIGRLVLKGKTESLRAFEPVAATRTGQCASPVDYGAALSLLQSGQADQIGLAHAAFETLAERYPQDPLVRLHLQRLRQGATDDLIVMAEK